MKRKILYILIVGILLTGQYVNGQDNYVYGVVEPKPFYNDEARLTTQILETLHFKKMKLNDSLSAVILEDYIGSLDNSRSFFLQSDIDDFSIYKNQLDDYTKSGIIEPAYTIFDRFAERFAQRIEYVNEVLIPKEFDYSVDEEYRIDRSEAPWAQSEDELNEIWRKTIKNQKLSLRINGKEEESIQKTLRDRYATFEKNLNQYSGEDVFELYMSAIAEAFDPHTTYLSPRTSDRFDQSMKLSLEGIGARLTTENDYTKVVQVLPGGPAEASKQIHENDRIISVGQGEDGELVDVIGWRVDDVVKLIKGPKGTVVQLEILPAETGINGPSKVVTLTRDKIKLEDLEARAEVMDFSNGGKKFNIGVITLPSFYMDFDAYYAGDRNYKSSTRDVKKLVVQLKEKGVDGILIDLRNNGGGSLEEAIDLTGLFIEDGPVVQIKASDNSVEIRADEDKELLYDGPLAVMINRFSASASEIFAGAIQDYERGVVIGEQTFGKGTVQSVIPLGRYLSLPDDEEAGNLKITYQKFYRVTGSSTQHQGVTPDVLFPSAFTAEEFGESASASALPWDQIRGTRFREVHQITDEVLSRLNRVYEGRLQNDPDLKQLVQDTEDLKNSLGRTTVSLNEEVRKAELQKAEEKKNNPSQVDVDKENQQVGSTLKLEDKYLKEGILLLSDMISTIG